MKLTPRRGAFLLSTSLLLVAFVSGCTSVVTREGARPREGSLREEVVPRKASSTATDPTKYRLAAIQYEKSQQPHLALFMWQVVDDLSSADPEAREKIKMLEADVRIDSEKHVSKGIELARSGSGPAAQKEFLLALAIDPDNKEALRQLRQETLGDGLTRYELKEGDTPATVAKKIYGDAGMSVAVSYFNQAGTQGPLRQGGLLLLPAPEQKTVVAKAGLGGKTKGKTVSVIDKGAAEQHYAAGVGYFLEQKLPEAVKEWEEALRLNPNHPNARRDTQKTRSLMKKEGSK
jgi:tetratricopeptide (TPR) repeat protein